MRFRSKVRRIAGLALLGLVASAVLSACDKSPSILQPAGPIAQNEAYMAYMVFGVAAVVFVLVTAALIYCIIRFRDRPGAAEARQLQGNQRLEIIWTVVPTLLLFGILFFTIRTMFLVATPPSPANITVNVIGHQWWWEFDYQQNGKTQFVTADELHAPVNAIVHLNLISDNVIHSFWIPQLTGKTDVIPGHNNTMWFQATSFDPNNPDNNVYRGACAEFCGTQHAHMDFIVVIQTQSDYNSWVTQQMQPAATPAAGSQAAAGLKVFQTAGCEGCHAINGVTPPVKGLIGPNLTHFGSRQLIAGGVLSNTADNLFQWVYQAQTVKPGVDMPDFNGSAGSAGNLSQDQVNALVAYLESLQ